MTAQISDILRWDGEDYAISAVENDWPFEPEEHGFKPVMLSTACWRGYHCMYETWRGRLLLRSFVVGLKDHEKPPVFRGTSAKRDELTGWRFESLEYPISYSGALLLGREFQSGFYVHMGFHRPHCYGEVYELFFERGTLIGSKDHSAKMAELRGLIRKRHESPASAKPMPERQDLNQWIRDCFSLDYGVKKNWE